MTRKRPAVLPTHTAELSDADAAAITSYPALCERRIARSWELVGIPADEAARRAAGTPAGVATLVGAPMGFAALGIPAAVANPAEERSASTAIGGNF